MPLAKEQRVLGALMLSSLPRKVQRELVWDRSFCDRVGYRPSFSFPIGDGTAVRMTSLHRALRQAVAKERKGTIELSNQRKVAVRLSSEPPGVAIVTAGKRQLRFPESDLLSPRKAVRAAAFDRVLKSKPLSAGSADRWRRVLESRSLSDTEFVDLMTAFGGTPEALQEGLSSPQALTLSKLVPDSLKFFEELVLAVPTSGDLQDFLQGQHAQARAWYLNVSRDRAVRRIARLSVAPTLTLEADLQNLTVRDLKALVSANDPYTLFFGFDLCRIRAVDGDRAAVSLGSEFLGRLLGDREVAGRRSAIFSACAIAATVKMREAFADLSPPLYWTRLAVFAHAGLLCEALYSLPAPRDFLDWMLKAVGAKYVWHSVIDRRDSHRWHSDWVRPEQLTAELVGRVVGSLAAMPMESRPRAWIKTANKALLWLKKDKWPMAAIEYPGPLDDFPRQSVNVPLSEAMLQVEREVLAASDLASVPQFAALVFLGRFGAQFPEQVGRLVEKIEGGWVETRSSRSLMAVAADLAACARSESVAKAVIDRCMIALRSEVISPQAVTDLFGIVLTACACHADPNRYYRRVSEVVASFIYAMPDDRSLLGQLHSILHVLLLREPKLIPILARPIEIVKAALAR